MLYKKCYEYVQEQLRAGSSGCRHCTGVLVLRLLQPMVVLTVVDEAPAPVVLLAPVYARVVKP